MLQDHISMHASSETRGSYSVLRDNLACRFAGDPDLLCRLQTAQAFEDIIEALALSYLAAINIVHRDGASRTCNVALRDHALELAEDREDAIRTILTFFERRAVKTPTVTVRVTGQGGLRISAVCQASVPEPRYAAS